jgi:hypothetical protein
MPKIIYKRVRLWLYQTNLSGNVNGHFEMIELPEKSTEKDVMEAARPYYWKCFNIRDLGTFFSPIGNKNFCPANIGKQIPKQKIKQ